MFLMFLLLLLLAPPASPAPSLLHQNGTSGHSFSEVSPPISPPISMTTSQPNTPIVNTVTNTSPFGPFPPSSQTVCSCYHPSSISYNAPFPHPDYSMDLSFVSFSSSSSNQAQGPPPQHSSSTYLAFPGESVQLRMAGHMRDRNVECPNCVSQVYVRGFGGFSLCLGSDVGSFSFDVVGTFLCPQTPGVYEFLGDWGWQFECNSLYGGSPPGPQVLATVIVTSAKSVDPALNGDCTFGYNEQTESYHPQRPAQDCASECEAGLGVEKWFAAFCFILSLLPLWLHPRWRRGRLVVFKALPEAWRRYCRDPNPTAAQKSALLRALWLYWVVIAEVAALAFAIFYVSFDNTCALVKVKAGLWVFPVNCVLAELVDYILPTSQEKKARSHAVESDSIRTYSRPMSLPSLGGEDHLGGVGWSPECSICMERMTLDQVRAEEVRVINACEHAFHEGCLKMWVRGANQNHRNCPLCRVEVDDFDKGKVEGFVTLELRNASV